MATAKKTTTVAKKTATPIKKTATPRVAKSSNTFELKDRTYILKRESTPLSYILRSKHTKYNPLLFFDGKSNRALRYSTNQGSCFIDEQDDNALISYIEFIDGSLTVPKEQVQLQKLLSMYHPDNGIIYSEFDPEAEAEKEYENLVNSVEAQRIVMDMEIEDLEAIARVAIGKRAIGVMTKELRRDMLIWAGKNPTKFIDLANDSDIKMRNLAIRANDLGIIRLADKATSFRWGNDDSKIVGIPFGQNPYVFMTSYLKSEEGLVVLERITNSF